MGGREKQKGGATASHVVLRYERKHGLIDGPTCTHSRLCNLYLYLFLAPLLSLHPRTIHEITMVTTVMM